MTTGKKISLILVLAAVIGLFVFAAVRNVQNQEGDSAIPKNAYPVQYELPHHERIVGRVTARGEVALANKTYVYASSTAEIVKLHVEEGDRVEEGQVLAEYGDKGLEAIRNSLDEARLTLKTAQLGLQTAQTPPTAAELTEAELRIKQYEKAIQDIEAQYAQLELSAGQLGRSIETAEKKHADAATLYERGAVAKTELDAAYDALQKLNDQRETLEAERAAALAGLPLAEDNLAFAREQYNNLLNREDDARVRLEISRGQLAVEQAQLLIAQLENQLADFEYQDIAPVSGTVINLLAAEGENAAEGALLLEIADLSEANLVVRADVPESDAGKLALGQEVEITADALGKTVFAGTLSKINPLAEKKQLGNSLETVLAIEVSIADAQGVFRPGYTVETSVITQVIEDTLVVPLMSTLTDTDGNAYVFVMRPDYSVEKRLITPGQYSGLYIQAGGVAEDDRIILNPPQQLAEGDFVRPTLAAPR